MKLRTTDRSSTCRLLGIDPGTAATGWGVIDYDGQRARLVAHGTITTPSGELPHKRLQQIHDGIAAVIDEYQPQAAAIEELFGGVNLKTALVVGQARGVAVLACAQRGVTPHDYTPLRIKQAVVGYGRAGKDQVQQMVKALLGLPSVPAPDHAADALAVAICHAHSMKTMKAMSDREGAGSRPGDAAASDAAASGDSKAAAASARKSRRRVPDSVARRINPGPGCLGSSAPGNISPARNPQAPGADQP